MKKDIINSTSIKNIIFDLGGVLLNIDHNKTANAFKTLGFADLDAMYSRSKVNELFEKLETGMISEQEFFSILQKAVGKHITEQQITDAWCAMLLDFRPGSLDHLQKLSKRYQLYLLSNTNIIHMRAFYTRYESQFGKTGLDDHFIKAYYSHQIKLRKPNTDIYEFVLTDAGIVAGETLFIDDTPDNLASAEALGIKTHLLLPEERIEELLT